MKRIGLIMALGAVLSTSACGRREPLVPAPGEALPPKAATARTASSPDEMMAPTVDVRPARRDELLGRSEERRDDYFDLPPQ